MNAGKRFLGAGRRFTLTWIRVVSFSLLGFTLLLVSPPSGFASDFPSLGQQMENPPWNNGLSGEVSNMAFSQFPVYAASSGSNSENRGDENSDAVRSSLSSPEKGPLTPTVSFFYLPAIRVTDDEDEDEENLGTVFEADLKVGTGWGARIGLSRGLASQFSGGIGLLYLTSGHKERKTSTHVRADAAYLEYMFDIDHKLKDFKFIWSLGFGVGVAGINFPNNADNSRGFAGEFRGGIGLEFRDRFSLRVGGGYFEWGYPGETVGNGAFMTTELGFRF